MTEPVNHIARRERLLASLLGLVPFAVYRAAALPSVGYIDSGELSAVAVQLGIAHPTGYPLFTLLGRIASMLPGGEKIVLLNTMSAFFAAAAVPLVFFIALELLEPLRERRTAVHHAGAFSGATALAFSQTFWRQGIGVEVYSLHLALLGGVLLSLLRAAGTGAARYWILSAFLLGLSFTNHMTTLLLLPAAAYLFFVTGGPFRESLRRLVVLGAPFAAGLSLYLYLPLRAASHPPLNWGNPSAWEQLLWHVSGKQFRVWMFTSTESARRQFEYFVQRLPEEFALVPFLIAAVGLFVVLFSDRRTFVFLALLFAACVGYSVNYDIHDIDSYFLLAFVATALFLPFGFLFIVRRFPSHRATIAAWTIAVTIAGIPLWQNWGEVEQHKQRLPEEYTRSILESLPPGAVVLSYQWDYFVAPSYYLQRVRSLRPDVVVLDKELFRRSWYFEQLNRQHPEVMQASKREIDAFLAELSKFEHGLPYAYEQIEGRYTDLLLSFVEKNSEKRGVFVTNEIEPQYFRGYQKVPVGILYKLTKNSDFIPPLHSAVPAPSERYRDTYSANLRRIIATAFQHRSEYDRYFRNDTLSAHFSALSQRFQ